MLLGCTTYPNIIPRLWLRDMEGWWEHNMLDLKYHVRALFWSGCLTLDTHCKQCDQQGVSPEHDFKATTESYARAVLNLKHHRCLYIRAVWYSGCLNLYSHCTQYYQEGVVVTPLRIVITMCWWALVLYLVCLCRDTVPKVKCNCQYIVSYGLDTQYLSFVLISWRLIIFFISNHIFALKCLGNYTCIFSSVKKNRSCG